MLSARRLPLSYKTQTYQIRVGVDLPSHLAPYKPSASRKGKKARPHPFLPARSGKISMCFTSIISFAPKTLNLEKKNLEKNGCRQTNFHIVESHLYQYPIATITNYHKLWRQQNLFLHSSGDQKSKTKVLAGPPKSLSENASLHFSELRGSRQSLVCGSVIPVSAVSSHGLLHCIHLFSSFAF